MEIFVRIRILVGRFCLVTAIEEQFKAVNDPGGDFWKSFYVDDYELDAG